MKFTQIKKSKQRVSGSGTPCSLSKTTKNQLRLAIPIDLAEKVGINGSARVYVSDDGESLLVRKGIGDGSGYKTWKPNGGKQMLIGFRAEPEVEKLCANGTIRLRPCQKNGGLVLSA